MKVDPDWYVNHQALGAWYFNRGAYEEAIRHFIRVEQLAPKAPEAHRVLGVAYTNIGKFSEASKSVHRDFPEGKAPAQHALGQR